MIFLLLSDKCEVNAQFGDTYDREVEITAAPACSQACRE